MESTTVYVVYGADELPYRRMIYGADSQSGITPGTFYDLRTTVVPFLGEGQPTLFQLKLDEQYLNKTHDVTVIREDPTFSQQTQFQIHTDTNGDGEELHSFQVTLGKGLNIFDIYVEGAKVYTFSVTATHYAKFIKAYSEAIQTNIWDPLSTLLSSIYASTATRLLDVYFGDVLNLLPNEENLLRFSQQLMASSVVRHAATETGLILMSSALFLNTPVISEIETKSSLSNLWIYPIRPRGDRHDREMRVWSATFQQGRYGTFAKLQENLGFSISQTDLETQVASSSLNSTTDDGDVASHRLQETDDVDSYSDNNITDISSEQDAEWAELVIESDQSMNMFMGERSRTQIRFPGLWDVGSTPWLDQGLIFDNEGQWDSGNTSGDPNKSFYIGTQIVPAPLGDNHGIGNSVLDRSVAEYSINMTIQAELTFE